MKTVKAESKKIRSNKIRKAVKPRCVAGVQIRSGVKAGRRNLPGGPDAAGRFYDRWF